MEAAMSNTPTHPRQSLVRRSNGIYYLLIRDSGGGRVFRSTGKRTPGEATQAIAEWEAKWIQTRAASNTETFTTKSGRSQNLPLHPQALEMLSNRKRIAMDSPLVFGNLRGVPPLPYSPSYVSHRFKRVCRHLELPDGIHFHSLRKSFGSWLVCEGVNIFEVSKLLRHLTASLLFYCI